MPDRKTLLIGSRNGIATLWDAQNGALIRPLCPLALDKGWQWVGVGLCLLSVIGVVQISRRHAYSV